MNINTDESKQRRVPTKPTNRLLVRQATTESQSTVGKLSPPSDQQKRKTKRSACIGFPDPTAQNFIDHPPRKGSQDLRNVRSQYHEEYGEAFSLSVFHPGLGVRLMVPRSREIARQYSLLPELAYEGSVKEAYDQAAIEIDLQYRFLKKAGFSFSFSSNFNYSSSGMMMKSLASNRFLIVFSGGENHPVFGENSIDKDGITVNEKFRAIHDCFGHAAEGSNFSPQGEERAWAYHSTMFSPTAVRAITTELRGQNSWVNFNSTMFNEFGWRGLPRNPEFLHISQRPFAKQKVTLLKPEFYSLASIVWT